MASPWARGSGRLIFRGEERPRIGIKWEVFVVDASTGALVPAASTLLDGFNDGVRPTAVPGLYRSIIRLRTGMHPTLDGARAVLESTMERLSQRAEARGLALIGSGTHPSSEWAEQEITPEPEAEKLVYRLQWIMRRMLTCGLNVLVGLPDGEKAIAVSNSLSCYVPLFIGLSGNSPYWRGKDTGLGSCRIRMLDNIPSAGIAPTFVNWAEFQLYLNTLRAANAIDGYHQIWWDITPSPDDGALAICCIDSPATLAEVMAYSAAVWATASSLQAQYNAGDVMLALDHWVKAENRWRAARFGMDTEVIASRDGTLVDFRQFAGLTTAWAADAAERLGVTLELAALDGLALHGSGSARQRAAFADPAAGGHRGVIAHLRREFCAGRPLLDELPALAQAGRAPATGDATPPVPAPARRAKKGA